MAGKMKHKSRSRVTYKHRMAAAQHVLNHYSIGKAHAKHKNGSRLLAYIKAIKKHHAEKSKTHPTEKRTTRKKAQEA